MTIYDSRLEGSEDVAEGTMAFHFARPLGFDFKPGQAIDLALVDPSGADPQNLNHVFSIVSAPFQRELVVATRMPNSAYKRALKALSIGAPVRIEGPFGSLTLHRDRARPAVLIAGGIGVTPFMSMLRQAAADRSPQPLTLVYSNRRPEDAAFLDELQRLTALNPHFRLVATMTGMDKSARSWDGARRLVDEAMVKSVAGDGPAPVWYLAGPPAMVEAMRKTLSRAGVDDDLRSEEFSGY